MKHYEDILEDFAERNKHISGFLVVNEPNRIGSVIYEPNDLDLLGKFYKYRDEEISSAREKYELSCVPDFSKMSITQAKTSESKNDTFEELFELCRKWKYRSWENETEFWFEPVGLIPAFLSTRNIVYVDKQNKVIYKKNNKIISNKQQLVDYIDSWWH